MQKLHIYIYTYIYSSFFFPLLEAERKFYTTEKNAEHTHKQKKINRR